MPVSSLNTKMSLAVSMLMTVVLLLLALSAFWYFESQFKDTISSQQFTLVSAMADAVDSKILNAQNQLAAVSGRVTSNLVPTRRQAQNFLDNRAGVRTVFDSGIFIFSPDGTLTAASPAEPQLQGRNYAFRDYIRKTIVTGRPQISAPFFSTQHHHHPIIMFTAPFFDARGKMIGILAGAVDLMRDNFLGKLATIKIGEKGYLYLYSTDRTLIVHHDRTRILRRDVPPGVNRLFDRAIEGFEGTGETVTSRGLHAVSSFKRIKSTNWILAANFPRSEAYAPIHRAKWYLLAALIIVPCFSVLTVWWFMHHLTAPLQQFTRHVKVFTGREEEPRPFRVTSRDEIGILAQTFNEMLAEMDKQKKTIREQKEFSENLLLNSAVPTFVLDSRHRVIIWNKACEELTGIKATEILGTADSWKAFYGKERPVLADIVIDGNDKELQFYYGSCSKSPFTPDGLQAEGWRRTANGRVFYAFFDTAPVRSAAGEIIAVIQTIQDITERKQMEETLRESEERYRRLVELSPDAIYIHTGGILVFANVTGAKLLGAERPEDLYGREALDFVHPDNRDLVVRRLNGLKLDGDSNPVTEEMFVRLDGSIVTVDVSSLIFIYQGKEAVLVVARDIREQKKMQEELLKAQKLESLGILAGGIAHDFNNILTGVLGNLSLANARLGPDHSIARYLGDCEKAVVQASKLTQQLLTFARGGEPVKKLIDAASLIRETASFVLRGSNVRSVIELADDLWSVEADSGQLNQALNNILINAAQSMPNGGEITVRAGNETLEPENMHQLPSGHYLRIVIEDRGCGIPSENLTRVFDPYFTTKTEGNGLGLASVYSIIKRHGGAVEVSSSVGIGSSITIHLPALPGELPEGEAVNKAPELIGNGRGRILIMDDEDFIRDIASEILEFMGYEVESCADGKEAVERFRKARESKIPYDAVILDLTIPGGMGGKEASALMLKIDPHAVLIVSSGYSNDPVVANFRQHGFSGVVSKPFDANGLARELDRLIQNKVDHV